LTTWRTTLAEWYVPELTEKSVDDVVAKLDAAAIFVSGEGTPVRLTDSGSVEACRRPTSRCPRRINRRQ